MGDILSFQDALQGARGAERVLPPGLLPGNFDLIKFPPRTKDVLDLFNTWQNEPIPPAGSGYRCLDISMSELWRIASLWHKVPEAVEPHPVSKNPRLDARDTYWRLVRRKKQLWAGFGRSLHAELEKRWTLQFGGLYETGGMLTWRRLFGRHSRYGSRDHDHMGDYPPCGDHMTLWRVKGQASRFAEVLVAQPYGYNIDEMTEFAKQAGLVFWISLRPAWHFPGAVYFIEWANPQSRFAKVRATAEADELLRTIKSWDGSQLCGR